MVRLMVRVGAGDEGYLDPATGYRVKRNKKMLETPCPLRIRQMFLIRVKVTADQATAM